MCRYVAVVEGVDEECWLVKAKCWIKLSSFPTVNKHLVSATDIPLAYTVKFVGQNFVVFLV